MLVDIILPNSRC